MAAPPVAPSEVPSAPLIDTHAHLVHRAFAGDLADVLDRASAAGIVAIIVVGYDLASSRAAVDLSRRDSRVWATVGVHPHSASSVNSEALAELEDLAGAPRVVGIGETGLDFFRNLAPRADQARAFRTQLEIAARIDLPVVVHSRDAMTDTLTMLAHARNELPALRGVLHCFSGTAEDAAAAVARGFFVSFAGPLTYGREATLAAAAASAQRDRVVVETDCPYLIPSGYRGKRNEPAMVGAVARRLAELWDSSPAAVARQTSLNAASLFGLPLSETVAAERAA